LWASQEEVCRDLCIKVSRHSQGTYKNWFKYWLFKIKGSTAKSNHSREEYSMSFLSRKGWFHCSYQSKDVWKGWWAINLTIFESGVTIFYKPMKTFDDTLEDTFDPWFQKGTLSNGLLRQTGIYQVTWWKDGV